MVELLVSVDAVGPGVAPAVEEVAAAARSAAARGGRLRARRRVIDHPDLMEVMGAEDDLIELWVVADAVEVVPIRELRPRDVDEVEIDPLRPRADVGEVRRVGVEVLDQVIPDVPLPDDRVGAGVDLDHRVGPETLVAVDRRRIAAGGARLLGALALPGDREDVAVRQRLDVVVEAVILVGVGEAPQRGAVPALALDQAADAGRGEGRADDAGPQEIAAWEEKGRHGWEGRALPALDEGALRIAEERLSALQRRVEGVADLRLRAGGRGVGVGVGVGRALATRGRAGEGEGADEHKRRGHGGGLKARM